MFVKWNSKNHYFIFLFLAFFLIRVRKTALLSGFLGRGYLASYLAFLPKSRHFCPKTSDFASFRTYIVFCLFSRIFSPHIAQNQRTNQPVSALVITILPFQRLTRNRFVLNRARGFESHHLRQKCLCIARCRGAFSFRTPSSPLRPFRHFFQLRPPSLVQHAQKDSIFLCKKP